MKQRVIFAGTPDFSVVHLEALHQHPDVEIVAVYTQPDRPKGRGQKLQPSPVKEFALSHGLTVEQPVSLKTDESQATLKSYESDLMVVVAYGLLLPQAVLDMPRLGCINVHASLLPRWRGAAPIHRAIESGDAKTGVGLMQMDAGLDTGDVLVSAELPISEKVTTPELHDQLAELGGQTLSEHLPFIFNESITALPQEESRVTYAKKLTKAEAEIDWSLSAAEIQRKIRAFQPWPVAFTLHDGQAIRLWQSEVLDVHPDQNKSVGKVLNRSSEGVDVQCGEGVLRISILQPPNKSKMSATDFANGRDLLGKRFG